MAGFSELIKSFEKTRSYIRDFFVYGFKMRGDFQHKSSRTYDDEKRRAESWLGDVLRYDDSVRGRQISISVDSGHIYENPLYQVYEAKSFTENDIRLHFFLLDLLAEGSAKTLNETVDGLLEAYGTVFDPQTVRNKLREYTEEGLILTEKRGKTAYYRLVQKTAADAFAQYPGLADAVRFFSLDEPFGIVGAQMLKTAGLQNDLFLRKHHYIVRALEDAVLLPLSEAMAAHRAVALQTAGAKSLMRPSSAGTAFHAVPMQILSSEQTGRRYLTAYLPAQKRFHSFRLDFIGSVRLLEPVPEYEQIAAAYRRNIGKVFGVSFGMRQVIGNAEPLRLVIRYDPETEGYIPERLQREKRIGTLEQLDAGLCALTFDAFDPNEVMHWAKTLIGRIVSVSGGSKQVRGRFYHDIRRMQEMYGGQPDDTVS